MTSSERTSEPEGTAPPRIGFIGLGRMGGRLASRLLDAGYRLVVHDLDPAVVERFARRGAVAAASAAQVASQVRIVFLCLPVPAVVMDCAIGESGVVQGGLARVVVDLSTTGPTVAQQVAGRLAESGIALLDAPVSGGTQGAEAGTLTVMAAGAPGVLEEVAPVLRVFARHVLHVGAEPGQGQTMKLINNMLSAASSIASFEGLVYGTKAGLDPATMLEVLNVSSGRSFATQEKIPQCILKRNFPMRFTTDLMLKDVSLCIEEAQRLGVPMWVGPMVRQYLAFAVSQGDGPEDYGRTIRHLEQWAGVEFGRPE